MQFPSDQSIMIFHCAQNVLEFCLLQIRTHSRLQSLTNCRNRQFYNNVSLLVTMSHTLMESRNIFHHFQKSLLDILKIIIEKWYLSHLTIFYLTIWPQRTCSFPTTAKLTALSKWSITIAPLKEWFHITIHFSIIEFGLTIIRCFWAVLFKYVKMLIRKICKRKLYNL